MFNKPLTDEEANADLGEESATHPMRDTSAHWAAVDAEIAATAADEIPAD